MHIVMKDNAIVNAIPSLVNPLTDTTEMGYDIFLENGTLEQEQLLIDKLNRIVKIFLSMIETDLELDISM